MDYGVHPTRYEKLSDQDLNAMWRESAYKSLSEQEKLDLLQETVNRDAALRGEVGAPRVEFACDLKEGTFGTAKEGVIRIDYNLAVNGKETFTYNGQVYERELGYANLATFKAVIHEDVHCWQDQLNDGTIPASQEQAGKAEEYWANNTGMATVVTVNGKECYGSHYLNGVTPGGYYIYYFQSTERDAYRIAEERTNELIQELTARFGNEVSFQEYEMQLTINGYAATEKEAIDLFQNPDFVKDVNNVLMNQFYGRDIKVDPGTEKAVKAEMAASYEKQMEISPSENHVFMQGGKTMSLSLTGDGKSAMGNETQLTAEPEATELQEEPEKEAELETGAAGTPGPDGPDGTDYGPEDEYEDDFEL